MVLASDDVIFAWAIGKASLIVVVSFGSLVYAAWAVTYQKEITTHVGLPKNNPLTHKSSARAVSPAHYKQNNWTPARRSSPLLRPSVCRKARDGCCRQIASVKVCKFVRTSSVGIRHSGLCFRFKVRI
jgi:hypothetical protein